MLEVQIRARFRQFVERQVKAPSHGYSYNGEVLQPVVEEQVTIDDAFGSEFSYEGAA